ncbi:MAG: lysophospholipid acyltransferase family protein [Chloroflexota bacterium]
MQTGPYRPPKDGMPLWVAFWRMAHAVRPLLTARLEYEGIEHMPLTGGAVLASNHNMGPDYFSLALTSPRQHFYMAKEEAFNFHPIVTYSLHNTGVFPVKRGIGDIGALQGAIDKVKEGHVVGMYPEGTRSRDGQLQKGKSGTVRIAMAAQAPIIPAATINSQYILKLTKRPVVTVRYGEPLWFEGDPNDRELVRQYTHEMMVTIARLLPPELRGVYRDKV